MGVRTMLAPWEENGAAGWMLSGPWVVCEPYFGKLLFFLPAFLILGGKNLTVMKWTSKYTFLSPEGGCSDAAGGEYLLVVTDSGDFYLLFAKWKYI